MELRQIVLFAASLLAGEAGRAQNARSGWQIALASGRDDRL